MEKFVWRNFTDNILIEDDVIEMNRVLTRKIVFHCVEYRSIRVFLYAIL